MLPENKLLKVPDVIFTSAELRLIAEIFHSNQLSFRAAAHKELNGVMIKLEPYKPKANEDA